MRSRRTKGLVPLGALLVCAAIGGTVARGAETTGPTLPSADDVAVTVTTWPTSSGAPSGPPVRTVTTPPRPTRTVTTPPRPTRTVTTPPRPTRTPSAPTRWTVTKVVDGDTVWVARAGVTSKVRVIGIDTPEIGECGYAEATRNLRRVIGGRPVTLTAGARDDVDRYGRLLRYVDVAGIDAGLRQLQQGYAVARYDSRDGYGRHAREAAYVRADAASTTAPCARPDAGSSTSGPSRPSGGGGAGGGGAWPLAGDRHPCPQARPVKGNENSMIAHEPGDRHYGVTNPEQCFATMDEAVAAGFRPAKA